MIKLHTQFILCFTCPLFLVGQNTATSRCNTHVFEIDRINTLTFITQHIEILKDSTFQISFDSLQYNPSDYFFKTYPKNEAVNLPAGAAYWLRFKVYNKDTVPVFRFITVYQRTIERMQLFVTTDNKQVDSSKIIGCDLPFNTQPIPTHTPSIPFNFEPQKTYTIYLHIKQRDIPIATAIYLFPTNVVLPVSIIIWSGFLVGLSFFYLCIAMGMFIFMKKPLYFAYLVYIIGGFGYLSAISGFGYEHIWSNIFLFEGIAENVCAITSLIGFLLVSIFFFDTPQYFTKLDKVLKGGIAISILVIIIALLRRQLPQGTYAMAINVIGIVLIVSLLSVLVINIGSFYLFRRKEYLYFLLAFSAFLLTAIFNILTEMGYYYFRHWAHNILPNFTLFFEPAVILFILAYRVKDQWVKQKLKEAQLQLNILEQRQRISRDLHDNVGSTLNSISVFSEIAKQQIQAIHPEASPLLDRIGEASRDLVATINDIVWAVNPKNDQFENIALRMRLFAADLLMSKNVLINFQTDEKLNAINLNVEKRKHFYLIFKEAINNVYKYADCTDVTIVIGFCNTHIHMTITDNGKGFDTSNPHNGNGLKTMQERAEILTGVLSIHSTPQQGTIVSFSFPIGDDN